MRVSSVNHSGVQSTNQLNFTQQKEVAEENVTTEKSIEVDISKEGMEKYRKSVGASQVNPEAVIEHMNILKHGTVLMDSGFESMLYSEAGKRAEEKGAALNFQDKAENLFSAYAGLYDDIVRGYKDGTGEIYVSDENSKNGLRKLTKEEALAELDKSYGRLSENLEAREKNSRDFHKIAADTMKQIAEVKESRGRVADTEREYLKQAEQKDYSVNVDGLSKNMINAANIFKSQYGTFDIHTLLSKIKIFEELK